MSSTRLSQPEEIARPPVALDVFIAQMGITPATAWRWRKAGELETCNIHGRVYVLPHAVQEFNRRAAAGEFARHHVTPTSPRPTSSPVRKIQRHPAKQALAA